MSFARLLRCVLSSSSFPRGRGSGSSSKGGTACAGSAFRAASNSQSMCSSILSFFGMSVHVSPNLRERSLGTICSLASLYRRSLRRNCAISARRSLMALAASSRMSPVFIPATSRERSARCRAAGPAGREGGSFPRFLQYYENFRRIAQTILWEILAAAGLAAGFRYRHAHQQSKFFGRILEPAAFQIGKLDARFYEHGERELLKRRHLCCSFSTRAALRMLVALAMSHLVSGHVHHPRAPIGHDTRCTDLIDSGIPFFVDTHSYTRNCPDRNHGQLDTH